jgi:hypothetical protein
LAAWEKFTNQILADQEYLKKVAQAEEAGLFIEGSAFDIVMQALLS